VPAAFAAPAAPAAKAADTKDEVAYSYYLIPCFSYQQHRLRSTEVNYNNTADSFYIAGWLSAYNRLKPEEGVPEDTTLDDIMLWLEQYCHDNPSGNLEAGLFKFTDEIKPRHEAKVDEAPAKPSRPAARKPPSVPGTSQSQPSVEGLKLLPY
jgi:hypothetical protein